MNFDDILLTIKRNPVLFGSYRTIKKCSLYQKLAGSIRDKKFKSDFEKFRQLSEGNNPRFPINWGDRNPCLDDNTKDTSFDSHYIYHPAWAARIIRQNNPPYHVDISSTLHFCSILSTFIPVRFFDYRPVNLNLENLSCGAADLTSLPFDDKSITSLSCMHTIEHIGLGRYGDPLDPDGDLKAISELKRVLADNGNLLVVVPVGKSKIMFNAHRIYSYDQILRSFSDLELVEFSLISDTGMKDGIIKNATRAQADACIYGCGCYWFRKTKK
jgi:hypothetical protein